MTWQTYGENLEEKLKDLHDKVHRGCYRPRPARRTYIPKADGSKRPLSILCLEDEIVQQAVATVLEPVYEENFLGFSYGFPPRRGQHDALDAPHVGILRKQANWVLDADIRGFFDAMVHSWIIRFLEHRIADKRILRLIVKWLTHLRWHARHLWCRLQYGGGVRRVCRIQCSTSKKTEGSRLQAGSQTAHLSAPRGGAAFPHGSAAVTT